MIKKWFSLALFAIALACPYLIGPGMAPGLAQAEYRPTGTGPSPLLEYSVTSSSTLTVTSYLPAVFKGYEPPLVLRVGGSGEYAHIQDALAATGPSHAYLIEVAQGIYSETVVVTGTRRLVLQGGWAADFSSRGEDSSLTIVDGMAQGIVFDIRCRDRAQLALRMEGLTIRNGLATTSWHGGGISAEASGAGSRLMLALDDNTITGNSTGDRGGGVFLDANNSARLEAMLTGNVISDNTAENEGGGLRVSSAMSGTMAVTLTGNTITGNLVRNDIDGGGLAAYAQTAGHTSVLLEKNVLTANESGFGGGILGYAWQADARLDITLNNNLIAGNTARMMGGAIFSCSGVTGPGTEPGGAVYWKLTNNTITNNTATAYGDAVALYSGSTFGDGGLIDLSSRNDILWGNTDPYGALQLEVIVEPGKAGVATARVTYSDIGAVGTWGAGSYTLDHSLDVNPLFVDPAHGLFLLQDDSPAIDAGDPAPIYNDGHRPPGKGTERADMGAYGGPGN